MSRFEIAFSGQLQAGAELETVKSNLARLFQADEQRMALLFSGRRIVIKQNLDAASAEKYRAAIERAGARIEIVDMDAPTAPSAAASEPVTSPAEEGGSDVVPRDGYMAAFSHIDAPSFGIAPVGSDLQDGKEPPVAPELDLSQLSIAPLGSDMGRAAGPDPVPVPDTSHLKVVE